MPENGFPDYAYDARKPDQSECEDRDEILHTALFQSLKWSKKARKETPKTFKNFDSERHRFQH